MTTVGVLGAGQLGRMLALAGYPLGLQFRFLDPAEDAPASQVAERVVAPFSPGPLLDSFAAGLDVITYEFENVPVELAKALARRVPVFPPPAALEASQDRLAEKTLFRQLGLETAPFAVVESRAEFDQALHTIGLPAVLKTRRFGYDGKGQRLLRTAADAEKAWQALGGAGLILEGFVAFERELSQIAVRGRDSSMAFYPLVENDHAGGILRRTLAPAPNLTAEITKQAADQTRSVLEALDYVGVLAIEFFQMGNTLIANEMAPRVHNSGHWTIEGAVCSQFENHLRAIVGLPLGSTARIGFSAMLNLIGTVPDAKSLLALPEVHLHLYGKSPRPGHNLATSPSARRMRRHLVRDLRSAKLRWAAATDDSQKGFSPWPDYAAAAAASSSMILCCKHSASRERILTVS